MSFSNAPEVREIATRYINEHHSHLANAPIEYLFNAKTIVKKGKEVLGEAKLISGLNAFLITRDFAEPLEQIFVMIISKSAWDLLVDNTPAREAIVDHELSHFFRDLDSNALSILPHDIEEFNEVVRRHGPYMADIANFLKAAKGAKTSQIPFDFNLARENQEKDAAARDERAAEEELEQEKSAANSVRVVKGRKGKQDEERQAASGE